MEEGEEASVPITLPASAGPLKRLLFPQAFL
jgi:hypothetical protein